MHLQFPKIFAIGLFLTLALFQHADVGATASPDSLSGDLTTVIDTLNDSVTVTIPDSLNGKGEELISSPVKYSAMDSTSVLADSQVVYLYGKATVNFEDLELKADFIRIDMNAKEVAAAGLPDSNGVLQGKPEFAQGDQRFKATSMRYNFGSKKGKINYVITSEGEGYIHGATVKKDPENNFFIRNGQYTTCDQDTPHYAIVSSKLKVIKNDRIVTGPSYLAIENLPTPIAIPFGFFPNKRGRSSGIMVPAFGESAERGFYFQKLGYYFGFNDYFNLALTTDLYTKGSYTVDATSQYRKRYRYSGNFRTSYAYTAIGERGLPDFASRKDFHVNWTHAQDPKANPYSTFSANVSAGSSQYYRNTIASMNNYLSNTFQSSISWTKLFPDQPFNLAVSLNHWQNTITHDVRLTAPDVSFGISRISPFKRKLQTGSQRWFEKIGTTYNLRASNSLETKDSLLFKSSSTDQFRNGIQHSLPVSTSFSLFKYITLSPAINYTEKWYFRTTEYAWNNDAGTVDTLQINRFKAAREYSFSAGMLTRVYGMFQYKRGPVAAIRHVLTPSASISFRPDFSAAKYGYFKTVQVDTAGSLRQYSIFQNGIYGGPSSGKYGAMNFSLDNNLEMKVRVNTDTGMTLKKVKLLESLRFGASYNLLADSLKLSPVNFSGRTTFGNKMIFTFGGVLNPYDYDNLNRDYDRWLLDAKGRLFRLTAANASMNFSLAGKGNTKQSGKYSQSEIQQYLNDPASYLDFEVPYNLYVGYNLNYSKRGDLEASMNQSLTMNGDLSLTPKWKIGFNTWYDLQVGKFTSFSTSIFRDLHCWEMRLNWIPFGGQESYNFQINVKSSMLQDLKLVKRKDFWD